MHQFGMRIVAVVVLDWARVRVGASARRVESVEGNMVV
jgi:hypothetical protein